MGRTDGQTDGGGFIRTPEGVLKSFCFCQKCLQGDFMSSCGQRFLRNFLPWWDSLAQLNNNPSESKKQACLNQFADNQSSNPSFIPARFTYLFFRQYEYMKLITTWLFTFILSSHDRFQSLEKWLHVSTSYYHHMTDCNP